jgi:protein-tyrosine phosphatase
MRAPSSAANFPGGTAPTATQPVPTKFPARPQGRRRWKRFALIAIPAALIITFVIIWNTGLQNQFFPMNFGVVEPGRIYRSGQISPQVLRRTLADKKIGLIVNLSSPYEDNSDARAEPIIASEMGVPRISLPLNGQGVGDPSMYPKAIAAIVNANREGKAVLVHCQSGAQRTGGVIATYRMLVEGKSEEDAFAEAKRYGHRPHGNPKLIPFVENHLPEWKAELEKQHVAP